MFSVQKHNFLQVDDVVRRLNVDVLEYYYTSEEVELGCLVLIIKLISNKFGISVCFKPTKTLHQYLVSPKDKTEKKDIIGPVYMIPCQGLTLKGACQEPCIGETLKVRGNNLCYMSNFNEIYLFIIYRR